MKKFTLCFIILSALSSVVVAAPIAKLNKTELLAVKQLQGDFASVLTLDLSDKSALHFNSEQVLNSVTCVNSTFSSQTAPGVIEDIKRSVFNTPEKIKKYEDYSRALAGTIFKLPKDNGCRFKV